MTSTTSPTQQVNYGLSQDQLKALLYNCMKPVEINNSADKRHARVQELLRWFARHATGSANPKWAAEHAFELAYFIATGGMNQHIDLREVSQKSFARGFNASESDRSILLRHSCIQPDACVDEDNLKARIAQLEKTVAELREMVINPPTL